MLLVSSPISTSKILDIDFKGALRNPESAVSKKLLEIQKKSRGFLKKFVRILQAFLNTLLPTDSIPLINDLLTS